MNNKDQDLKLIRRHTSNIIDLQRTATNSVSLIVILTRIEVACNICQQSPKQNTDGEGQLVEEMYAERNISWVQEWPIIQNHCKEYIQ
jgi:hypothetical protein